VAIAAVQGAATIADSISHVPLRSLSSGTTNAVCEYRGRLFHSN